MAKSWLVRLLVIAKVAEVSFGTVIASRQQDKNISEPDSSCVGEWLSCSTSDDNALPCCEGLYCWVQSDYYAQCVEIEGGVPTMMPIAATPPSNPAPTITRVPANPSYQCGYPLLDTDYVNTEYAKWRDQYIIDTGVGLCVDQPDQGSKCVSEGLGYGMILAVSNADQETFDGLWEFTQHSFNGNGLPNWEMSPTGETWGNGSATDADLDIALGLLMAVDRWGAAGYKTSAVQFINSIMTADVDSTAMMLKPGDSWESNCPYNPSYFSPAHMSLFQKATGDDSWATVIENGYALLNDDCASQTAKNSGLVPDWTNSLTSCTPGTMDVQDMDGGADFYYDAIRTPWRLSLHASWDCDSRALSWTNNMANFFNSAGVSGLDQGFHMDGTVIDGDDSSCFISMCATAMVPAQSDDTIGVWYGATQSTTSGGGLYFCDTLRMLSLTFQAGLMIQPSL